MNPRNQNKSHKGASRKSASSAKPKREAAASVHTVAAGKARMREAEKQRKGDSKAERRAQRQREMAMGAQATKLPEYKKWRRYWLIAIIIAIVGVAVSWVINAGAKNGTLPASLQGVSNPIAIAAMVLGYIMIIIALVIDFKKLRPLRKAEEAKAHNLSKREQRALDEAIAARNASSKEKKSGKGKMPWSKGSEEGSEEDN